MPTVLADVYIDRVDDLSLVERHGVIQSLMRKARVLFRNAPPPSYLALSQALTVCPNPFSILSDPGYSALILVSREPRIAEGDPSCVDVTLKYEHMLDGPNQLLNNNPFSTLSQTQPVPGVLFGKGKCSITEKTTNFYYYNGDPANGQTPILVGHTLQPQEAGPVGMTSYPGLPNLIIQGGEITVPFPQSNFQLEGIYYVSGSGDPHSIAKIFVGKINSVTWLDLPPYCWLCSEAKWEMLDPIKHLYKFWFEFQSNIDTWNPTVVFNDQRTGRPPADLKQATVLDINGTPRFTQYPYSAAAGVAAYGAGFPGVLTLLSTLAAIENSPSAVQAPTEALSFIKPYLPDGSDFSNPPPDSPGTVIPAGIWQVPALKAIDFNQQFAALIEE